MVTDQKQRAGGKPSRSAWYNLYEFYVYRQNVTSRRGSGLIYQQHLPFRGFSHQLGIHNFGTDGSLDDMSNSILSIFDKYTAFNERA